MCFPQKEREKGKSKGEKSRRASKDEESNSSKQSGAKLPLPNTSSQYAKPPPTPVKAGPISERKALSSAVGAAEQPRRHFPERWVASGTRRFAGAAPRSSRMTTGHIGFVFSRRRQTPAPQRSSSSVLQLSNGSSAFNPGWGPHAQMSLSTQLFQNHGALFYSGGLALKI